MRRKWYEMISPSFIALLGLIYLQHADFFKFCYVSSTNTEVNYGQCVIFSLASVIISLVLIIIVSGLIVYIYKLIVVYIFKQQPDLTLFVRWAGAIFAAGILYVIEPLRYLTM